MAGIQTIRDNFDSLFTKIIVGAIVIAFSLFFGWGTMFSNSDADAVAFVNGNKIDLYDLDQILETKVDKISVYFNIYG